MINVFEKFEGNRIKSFGYVGRLTRIRSRLESN